MSDQPPECSDPLTDFSLELKALIQRWTERTGGKCEATSRLTFIDEESVDGFTQRRKGPLIEISLTVIDTNRLDESFDAYFDVPALGRALIERENQRDRARSGQTDAALVL